MLTPKDFDQGVAYRLRVLRKAFEKTQAQLGDKIGVGGTAVSNYEKGSRAVEPYAAFRLKVLFSIPFEWLYGGDESTLSPGLAEKLEEASKKIAIEDAAHKPGPPQRGRKKRAKTAA